MKRGVFYAILLITAACVAGCRPKKEAEDSDKPVVFVSILPQADFVEHLAGDLVDIQVMVGPGQSPHTYEPSPRQMTKLSSAKLFFRVGVSFEDVWMKRLAEINPRMRIVDTRQGIQLRTMEAHSHDHDDHHHSEDEQHGGIPDPHIWLDPNLVKVQAQTMFEALAELLPESREGLQVNLESFLTELEELDKYVQKRLRMLENRKFLVFHPSWGYFADAYNLEQVSVEIEGKEPSGRVLVEIIEHAQEENIKVVFVQQQFSDKTAQTIATAIGGKVIPIDPLARDYGTNLKYVADTLAEELGK